MLTSLVRPGDWNRNDVALDNQQRIRRWTVNLENPLDKQTYTVIDLTETPSGSLEPGYYLLEVHAPEVERANRRPYRPRHLLVVSDLNLTLKVGPKEALVWATDLDDGAPVSDVEITFYDYDQGAIGQATTDADGVARIDVPQFRYVALVASERPFAAVGIDWARGISPWDFGMGQGEYSQDFRTYIYTDRPIYRPGQTIHFKGVVRSEDDVTFRLPDLGQVQVVVRDAAYNEIFNDSLPLSEAGTFNGSVTMEEGAALGNYTISVDFANHYFEQLRSGGRLSPTRI